MKLSRPEDQARAFVCASSGARCIKAAVVATLITLCSTSALYSQKKNMRFDRISLEQGLSQNVVWCILQDRKGFMWFGTEDGLNKYNGYDFTVYKNDPDDPSSISDIWIICLFEDEDGILWVGTRDGGLNRFDPKTEIFTRYLHDPADSTSLSDKYVLSIYRDRKEILWVGTLNGGLNRLESDERTFTHFRPEPNDPGGLASEEVGGIFEDEEGVLWLTTGAGLVCMKQEGSSEISFVHYRPDDNDGSGTNRDGFGAYYRDNAGNVWLGTSRDGISKFNFETKTFTPYRHDPKDANSLSYDIQIGAIAADRSGMLWITTRGGGLNKFDPEQEIFTCYQHNPADPNSLSDDGVMSVYMDRTETLWVGTEDGLSKFDYRREAFPHYKHDAADKSSLSHNNISSFCEDQKGDLWVGSRDGGLNLFDRDGGRFVHYRHKVGDPNSLIDDRVYSIYEDHEGVLWVGTENGLSAFDQTRQRFSNFKHDPKDSTSLGPERVFKIYEDRFNNLWFLDGFLSEFDRESGKFTHYGHDAADPQSLGSNDLSQIFEDRQGRFWVTTDGAGLNRLIFSDEQSAERRPERFVRYRNDPDDPNSLSHDATACIYQDSKDRLWIGTYGGGLNKFDPATETFTAYREKDGMPSNSVYGILEDEEANLWMSTSGGLARFTPESGVFKNYDVTHGLQRNLFNLGAYLRTRNGELLFGGGNGFNIISPTDIGDNRNVPAVYITELRIFNESVALQRTDENSPLARPITWTTELHLSYKDSPVSFEFAALDFSSPEKNKYAYKLEGLEDDWTYSDSRRRFATYTNLPSGSYTFKVKGSNNDGLWNDEGASVRIVVAPPFWETWWFRTLIAITALGAAFGLYKVRIRSIEAQKRKLEIQVVERTKEIKEQKDEIEEQRDHILSSIQYAKRIQKAILPRDEKLQSALSQHFVIFRPKDIVSGDFFWFSDQVKDEIMIGVFDCTGHGVPGAFMSMIGNTILNETVNEKGITDPALVLERLHREVRSALSQENAGHGSQDGMDVCLCRVEPRRSKVTFSGAKRPLFVVRNGDAGPEEPKFVEIKGDRKSIGGRQREAQRIFTNREVVVGEGDVVYLTSDGFIDQSNPAGKRFGSRRLKNLFDTIAHDDIEMQKERLLSELDIHQGEAEQRDDITVIGVKF